MGQITLSQRLMLEEAVQTPDGAGGYLTSWHTIGVLWANVDARSGRVRDGGAATLSVVRYRIVVRAAPVGSDMRPSADQRFLDGVQAYVIDAVAPHDVAGLYLECWARVEMAV